MPQPEPASDYPGLRQEGIRHLERLASHQWTDFNAHDPGITILEQFCYAITDLGYRTGFDIPDLLAEGGENGIGRLYRPSQVLTCHPVTLTDLRKLAMDVDGVKNAWIEPVERQSIPLHYHPDKNHLALEAEPPATEPVYLKGLYRVLVEKSALSDIDGETVRRAVAARLHANRGLCEDFELIELIGTQDITIDARIEIGRVEDVDGVLLGIYERISNYLSPTVPFRTLAEMLADGKGVDEIFDGPALQHGFLDSAELKRLQRRVAVHSSDLIREIMQVEGVRAVRSITLRSGSRSSDWALEIASNKTPALDLAGSSILLQRDRIGVHPGLAGVIEAFNARRRQSTVFRKLDDADRDVVPAVGKDRKLARYRSVQHQFPLVYGIGAARLPGSASPARKAQARQLKAYLMLFDQLLANMFAQLAHAKDLLSFRSQDLTTYFSAMIDDPELDLEPIRTMAAGEHRKALERITEDPDIEEAAVPSRRTLDRRNRFLSHLLARFAEHFTDYSLMLHGEEAKGGTSPAEKLIRDKEAFLQRYPLVSAGRGTGFDYTKPAGPGNVSGLDERIRLKLGLVEGDDESFVVIEHILLRAMAADRRQGEPLLAAARSKDPYSLQLSLLFPNWPVRFKDAEFRLLVEQTVREETPAHLTPYVHWLGRRSMASFREAHRDWTERLRLLGAT